MNQILESIKPIIKKSKQVKINQQKLKKFCLEFNSNNKIEHWIEASPYNLSQLDDFQKLNFIFVLNSINFCYWGNPKWTIKYKNKLYDGAWGLVASFGKAIEAGIPIFDAQYLSSLTKTDLLKILKGNVIIPLFNQRLEILKENGRILKEKYNGQFSNVLARARKNALTLLKIFVTDFPSFNDSTYYDHQKVIFHKRAQLSVSDIYHIFKGRGFGSLKNINLLTALADYKIPQSLRKLGILKYSPKLKAKIDNKIQIKKDSKEEIEIRANMIWAIELIKKELKTKEQSITSTEIDSYLWFLGQDKSPQDKPYHLTRTIFY